jgi:hypothetical protein
MIFSPSYLNFFPSSTLSSSLLFYSLLLSSLLSYNPPSSHIIPSSSIFPPRTSSPSLQFVSLLAFVLLSSPPPLREEESQWMEEGRRRGLKYVHTGHAHCVYSENYTIFGVIVGATLGYSFSLFLFSPFYFFRELHNKGEKGRVNLRMLRVACCCVMRDA